MNSQSLTSSKETPYFIFSVIVSLFIYIIAMVSIIGIAIALVLFGLLLFSNAIMLGSIRGNGVRINEKQFPDIYERVVELSIQMKIKDVPDVFVIHSQGAFNAFATRFFGRNMVVIYSEVLELAREQGQKELDFIIAHELAHIKRRHVWKSILVLPANFVPFLSQAYSRACEYTCDRKAAYYIQDGFAAKRSLTILSIGKGLYKEINDISYLEQIHSESNVAVWFAEVLSTHPILPKRIQAVGQFMEVEGTPNFQPNTSKIAIGAVISGLSIFVIYIGMIVLLVVGIGIISSVFPSAEESNFEESSDFAADSTPLMIAAATGNLKKVESLLEDGADLLEVDEELTTALHYAVYNDETEVVEFLLKNGANPNDSDHYTTALTAAIMNEFYDIAALLFHSGADPTLVDAYGESPITLFEVETVPEFEYILNDLY
ncbi:M48 family metallopeptidase [Sporosarcina sp. FA9]|uniref:M48 family metallopeptidase n=1 Tax=Sporosarcina sp. FA9 TaxID=3413030 RepID=UPI003F65809C